MENKVLILTFLISLTTSCFTLDNGLDQVNPGLDELTLQDGYDYSLATSTALTFLDLIRADKVCEKAGHMCKNCTTRVNCVEISPGIFEEIGPHTCMKDETCKTTDCEVGRNPPCEEVANLTFVCKHTGMFPNPFFCQLLHICAPTSDGFVMTTVQCGGKYLYNPLTTYCDIPLQADGTCYAPGRATEWPVPPCDEDGEMGAIIENPTIYFICEKHPENEEILYPFLRLCPNGGSFNEETMICESQAPPTNSGLV